MQEKTVGGKDNQMVPCDSGGTQCGDMRTVAGDKAIEQQCIQ